MLRAVSTSQSATQAAGDRRLVLIGLVCAGLSMIGLLMHAVGIIPPAAATLFVLLPVGIGMRVVLVWAARSASDKRRAHIMNLVSWIGLAVSAITIIALLPRLTKLGGMDKFIADLFANGWTIVVLTLAAGSVRTLTWRAFLGTGLLGFLGVTALARLIDQPVIDHWNGRLRANSGLVPLTEELLKVLPVVIVVWLAARRKSVRPSAADIVLLAMWSGMGFALYEDTLYGRGRATFGDAPLVSLLFPSVHTGRMFDGTTMVFGGHLVWTGLIGLGLAIGVLYGRRFKFAWLAIPVAVLVALGEHGTGNGLSIEQKPTLINLAMNLSLRGWLSSILLIGGTTWIVLFEWRRAIRGSRQQAPAPVPGAPRSALESMPTWLWVTRGESARRSRLLARLQAGHQPARSAPAVGAPQPVGVTS